MTITCNKLDYSGASAAGQRGVKADHLQPDDETGPVG